MEGMPAKHAFPVRETEATRIQRILEADHDQDAGNRPFLVFEALNGWTVIVRLSAVEAARILIDPIDATLEHEPAEALTMRVHLGDAHDPLSLSPSYTDEVAALLFELETTHEREQRRFIALRDEDDEWLHLGVNHIRLIQISSDLLSDPDAPDRPDSVPSRRDN